MLKATLFNAILFCYLSASNKGSTPSAKRTSKGKDCKAAAPHPPAAAKEDSHFVIITPPVSWKSAKDVCEINGFALAKLNEQNFQVAVNFVNSAKHNRVWIDSYMGHGVGDDAAVMLRPGQKQSGTTPAKPSTIKIMRDSKAAQCKKVYPVLCIAKGKCPPTESSSQSTKCKKAKRKKCPQKKEKCVKSSSSKVSSDPPCDYVSVSSSPSSTLFSGSSMSDSFSVSYSFSNDSCSRSYSYEYSPSYSSMYTSSYNYCKSSSSSASSSFSPSNVIEIDIIKSKKKGSKTKK